MDNNRKVWNGLFQLFSVVGKAEGLRRSVYRNFFKVWKVFHLLRQEGTIAVNRVSV